MLGTNPRLDQSIPQARVLVVDDQQANVHLLEAILSAAGYSNIVCTTDSRQTAPITTTFRPDLILLDLMMPHMDGFAVLEQLRSVIPENVYLPILVLTADITREAKRHALSMGVKDFLTKPFDNTEVVLRIRNLLETRFLHLYLQEEKEGLEEKVKERTAELEASQIEMFDRLAMAAEHRDDATGQHTRRVGHNCVQLARALGLPEDQLKLLQLAAPLHDVGKIGIPDAILLKPGRFTPEEFDIMKTHTTIGGRILSGGQCELTKLAQQIALTHHERWDGSGYPHQLKGLAIPIAGRILAVADVFDALTHARPYKQAWSRQAALAEIEQQSGRQFDPRVVQAFLTIAEVTHEPKYAPVLLSNKSATQVRVGPQDSLGAGNRKG